MKLNWSRADAKRAEKMGWELSVALTDTRIIKHGGRFKTDAEAARWVFITADSGYLGYSCLEVQTCNKAVLICCGGAR